MKASLFVALAAALFLCATPRTHAQAAPADSVTLAKIPVRAVKLTAPVKVDGVLDEPVWSNDQPVTNFTQRDPVEGAPPSQRTEVRLAYDDDALYVGARLFDTAPDSIIARLTRRDVSIPADRFALYLDPLHDRRSGYYFLINAAGTLFDGTLSNDGWEDPSWDGVWEGRARIDDKGWTLEMKIPYSQLRFANQGEECLWGVNFRRVVARRSEEDFVVYQPKKAAGFVSRFPDLVGIEHIKPGSTLELLPYVTGKAAYTQTEPGDPFNSGTDYSPNMGLDIRTSLGSKLTMIGTINPDFGQVEVDPAVVNLSDNETFYPEKRPFFVEGSANFSFGQQGADDYWGFNWPEPVFFYSRRIGAAPSGGTPDADYEDYPSGTTILGAGKLTGKIAPSVNLGTLFAVTASEHAQLSGNPAGMTSFEVEPLTAFGVARLQKEFPERRQGLGFMATGTTRKLDDDVMKSQFNQNSLMAGTDGWWFLDHKKTYVVSGWSALSYISGNESRISDVQLGSRHYFQRPDADQVRYDPTRTSMTGFGSRYWVNRQNGNMIFNSAVGFMSPDFELNDIGFMSYTDVINVHIGGGYKWTEPTKHRKYQHVIGAIFSRWDFDGNRTNSGIWAQGSTEFSNNYSWNYTLAYNPQSTSTRLTRGGPRVTTPPGYQFNTYFDTDSKSKVFYFLDTGTYIQPDAHSYNYWVYPGIEFKPVSNVTLNLGPGYEQVREYTQYITTVDNPASTETYGADYVFATLDQRMISANIRLNWAFNPSLSLQFYGQPLIAIGEYDDYKKLAEPNSYEWSPYPIPAGTDNFNITSLRGNAVLRWEYRPGSAFYLVWSHDRYADSPVGQNFDFSGSSHRLFALDADNIFLAKFTYYFNL